MRDNLCVALSAAARLVSAYPSSNEYLAVFLALEKLDKETISARAAVQRAISLSAAARPDNAPPSP